MDFLDETISQTSANTARVWNFGKPIIKKNTTKINVNTIDYYVLIEKQCRGFFDGFFDNFKIENISDFLIKIKETNLEYSAIIVILDNFKSRIIKR